MTTQTKRNFRYPQVKVKFQSLKVGKTVVCNSKLEADFALLLEFDDEVLAYQTRSFCIYYKSEGKSKTFTPHFLLQKANRQQQTAILITSANQEPLEEKLNLRLISNVCRDHQILLEILNAEEIRQQPRLNNAKLLWRFSRVEVEPQRILLCGDFFASHPSPVFNDLLAYFKSKNLSYTLAFALLFRKIIEFDFNQFSLNENTPIYLGKNYLK